MYWREFRTEKKKKLPVGFTGFLGCPFDRTVLLFTEMEGVYGKARAICSILDTLSF